MLMDLSGNTHTVYTGVCMRSQNKSHLFYESTDVRFNNLDIEMIDFYLKNYQPLDKAGAYGIQEWIGFMGVERIEGSYYNVMGFPLHLVYAQLKKW